ncbi:MAG: ATP-dependent RNA helicase [Alphaproteobacteria bacterium CG11_big_fil_rev_8_21_14_0_20_39_49]|nr:MAG: ATP-dependent RNA helicase [Alphaproteobacteria bacterium CG11_big_fil_rev_8_21_14_0_20_39_49]
MKTFKEMGLPEALNHTLQHLQFNEPTPIQQQAIPLALEGRDILGSAQTGTGKTAAFGIPLVTKLMTDSNGMALVMTPTRELATQVLKQLQDMLGRNSKIKTAMLIGGDSMVKQLQQLRNRPRLIVGTPGRINDHLERGSLMLNNADFLVLDETDRMLDMGFSIQIDNIMKYMTGSRQTLLFSATLPKNIVKIADKYLKDPVHISVSPTSSPAANITQDIMRISEAEKYDTFLSELDRREGSIIVFVKTKYGTEKMAIKLAKKGYSADAIHGDLRQSKRERVIEAFRRKKYRILVATDVAARGLDIPHIEHVINYDLPQCAEDYIHRIGRTARAGAKGCALNLVSPQDKSKWAAIEKLLNPGSGGSSESGKSTSKSDPAKRKKNRFRNKNKGNGNNATVSTNSGAKKPARIFKGKMVA